MIKSIHNKTHLMFYVKKKKKEHSCTYHLIVTVKRNQGVEDDHQLISHQQSHDQKEGGGEVNFVQGRNVFTYLSLKYKIAMMAITRTVSMQEIVHLFLFILLVILVKILLLLPTLSSTP